MSSVLSLLTSDNLARLKKYLPALEVAKELFKDARADELTTDHIGLVLSAAGIEIDASRFQPFIDMIPRFMEDPDQKLSDFVKSGGLKHVFEFASLGQPKDAITACPHCNTPFFRLAEETIKGSQGR